VTDISGYGDLTAVPCYVIRFPVESALLFATLPVFSVFSSRALGQNSGNCYNLYITVGGPKDKRRFFTAFTNHLIRTLFWG